MTTMSLLPFLIGRATAHRLIDHDFGDATPDDLTAVVAPMLAREYYRPWRHMGFAATDLGSHIVNNKEKFQVNLDVQHFAPEEISVRTAADGYVIIEGKHEEKKDEHGFVSRQFSRRYILPENCDSATVESRLSSDGVLTVIAPKVSPTTKNERSVPITPTGPVRKEIKDAASQQTTPADANGTAK